MNSTERNQRSHVLYWIGSIPDIVPNCRPFWNRFDWNGCRFESCSLSLLSLLLNQLLLWHGIGVWIRSSFSLVHWTSSPSPPPPSPPSVPPPLLRGLFSSFVCSLHPQVIICWGNNWSSPFLHSLHSSCFKHMLSNLFLCSPSHLIVPLQFTSHLDTMDRNWREDPFWRDLYPRWAEPIFKEGIDVHSNIVNDRTKFAVDIDCYQFRPEEIQVRSLIGLCRVHALSILKTAVICVKVTYIDRRRHPRIGIWISRAARVKNPSLISSSFVMIDDEEWRDELFTLTALLGRQSVPNICSL